MATQDGPRIALSLAAESDQRHFRLLELPPGLLALLAAENPPTLELKAGEGAQDGEGGHTVLCTQDRTFDLRQKNSSNAVYLLEPRESAKHDLPVPALHAIAQCHSTLELSKANITTYEAWKLMRATVPCFLDNTAQVRPPKSARHLFDEMPFHESLCQEAFHDVVAWEHPETGLVYRHDPGVALAGWKAITTTSQLKSVRLDEPFLLDAVIDLEHDPPGDRSIVSMLQSFSTINEAGLITLHPERCTVWVGRIVLEHEAQGKAVDQKAFVDGWKDLLPEKWRELPHLSKLALYAQINEDGKSVQFKEPSPDSATSATGSAAGKKRKWHEKFRSQKK